MIAAADAFHTILQGHPLLPDVKSRIHHTLQGLQTSNQEAIEAYLAKDYALLFASLVLWSGEIGYMKQSANQLVKLAAAVELLHLSTDVQFVECCWDTPRTQNSAGIRSISTTAATRSMYLHHAARIVNQLHCESVLLASEFGAEAIELLLNSIQLSLKEDNSIESTAKNRLLEKAYCKMGHLTATSCKLGAQISHAAESLTDLLTSYGYAFGMAFYLTSEYASSRSAIGQPHLNRGSIQKYINKANLTLKAIPNCLAKSQLAQMLEFIRYLC